MLEGCWNCGTKPVLKDEKDWKGQSGKRYLCPACQHFSSSQRATEEEARKLWNRTAKTQITKREKYG